MSSDEHKQDHQDPERQHFQGRDTGLYLIGFFKLAKALLFLGISLGALHFVHHDLSDWVDRLLTHLRVDPESRLINLVLDRFGPVVTEKTALITHHKLRLISMGTSLYAALCSLEAYGLLRRKVWAEFVTLWLSVSFVPWELYELTRLPSLWHFGILAANLVIVAYLLWMLRRKKQRAATQRPVVVG